MEIHVLYRKILVLGENRQKTSPQFADFRDKKRNVRFINMAFHWNNIVLCVSTVNHVVTPLLSRFFDDNLYSFEKNRKKQDVNLPFFRQKNINYH